MSSSFRSSSISLGLHGQVIPDFVSDMLLEGNMASVLGNYDDPEDQGATGCCVLAPGSVPPPPPSPPLPHPPEPLHLLPYPGLVAPVPRVSSRPSSTSWMVTMCPEWCWALGWVSRDPGPADASLQRSLKLDMHRPQSRVLPGTWCSAWWAHGRPGAWTSLCSVPQTGVPWGSQHSNWHPVAMPKV